MSPSYRAVASQQAWGLFKGDDLVASVRSKTIDGAISKFKGLPPHLRGKVEPDRFNVIPLR